jgi:SEC-C motif domain protein
MNSINCYCCSNKTFENCCEPFISGTKKPETCLQLMRSRYSGYVLQNAEYLLATTHISERKYYSKTEILDWATLNTWQKLEIVSFSETTVEFKAYYLDANQKLNSHHEFSNFKIEDGFWFYVDGEVL